MLRKALVVTTGSILLLASTVFALRARADEGNQASELTFSQPVQVPGNRVLPAGTYWFVVPDVVNGGDTVQIFSADRTRLIATLETVPTERSGRTGRTELTFVKLSPNVPAMLTGWFYPRRATGHEFVYSPKRERRVSGSEEIAVFAHAGLLKG
jgi:hypothetical protein